MRTMYPVRSENAWGLKTPISHAINSIMFPKKNTHIYLNIYMKGLLNVILLLSLTAFNRLNPKTSRRTMKMAINRTKRLATTWTRLLTPMNIPCWNFNRKKLNTLAHSWCKWQKKVQNSMKIPRRLSKTIWCASKLVQQMLVLIEVRSEDMSRLYFSMMISGTEPQQQAMPANILNQ